VSKGAVLATVIYALLLADATAVAGKAQVIVTVDEAASLPDGVAHEIQGALESRASLIHADLVEVHLTDLSADITVDGRARSIAVDDWRREGAARVVVTHALDLAGPPPDLPVPGVTARRTDNEAAAPASPSGGEAAPVAMRIVMSFAPLLSHGANSYDATAPGAEVSIGIRREDLRFSAFGRYAHGLLSEGGSAASATFDLLPAGLAVGWSWGSLEAAADVFVGTARLEASFGGSASSVTYGGGASLRWLGTLTSNLGWFAGAGADAFARRLVFEIGGQPLYATPRVSIYATAGLTFGFTP
jgi:hypothetical protein